VEEGDFLGAPQGTSGVDEQGPPAAVVADENLREVEAVLGLDRDQGVAFEVHELGALDRAD
jgi:hypothetical protein